MPRRSAGAGPDIALLIELDLPGVAHPVRQKKLNQILCLWIEPVERIITGSTNPDMTVGCHIKRVGNLVLRIRKIIDQPLFTLWVKPSKNTGGKSRDPDHSVRRHVQATGTAEGWVPFLDVAVRGSWVNAPDAVTVKLAIPDHPVHR